MKIKIYQIIGWILVGLFGLGGIVNVCQPHKFQRFIANPAADLFPAVYGILASFALNPFLWLGVILLWRADRNKKPNEKSKWGAIIKGYLIFTIAIVIITAVLILIPNLQRMK
ncbi:MAG: hypothetical protein FJZ11_00985 [Candidatus Omnitrophica bacterium]|nr:hypothetical protein [Candidatus Omnitrophota bacterium]